MSSATDVVPKGIALEQEPIEKKTQDSDVVAADSDSETGEIIKNSKAVSSWTIFASALANFSDGYQNNMVRASLRKE